MACSITQADLGPLFADVDADLATDVIETATEIVLGPTATQTLAELKYTNCGLDACRMIKLLAQHILATLPGSGVGGDTQTVTSERVGEVAVSYGNASSASGMYAGSTYGTLYASMLSRFERCQNKRNTFPRAIGTTRATNNYG